jgi:hypothetical protein
LVASASGAALGIGGSGPSYGIEGFIHRVGFGFDK